MVAPVIVDVDPEDRDAWLAARQDGIGSSDAAALFGMDRFASPWSVYVDKVEPLDLDEEQSEALTMGHLLEPVICDQLFAARHPEFFVVKPTVMFRHAEYPFAQCSPDRELFPADPAPDVPWPVTHPTGIVEAKSSRLDEDWSDDVPPDRVVIQCQHQMLVMNTAWVIVALLMHGRHYREFTVHRDDAVHEVLVNVEGEFWQRVLDRRPPPADGHAATSGAIKRLYDSVEEGSIAELGDSGEALLRRRATLKAALADIEADLSHVENELKASSHGAALWTVRGEPAATWNTVNAHRLDTKALKAAHPELVEEFTRLSPYRRLDVKPAFKSVEA